MGNRRK